MTVPVFVDRMMRGNNFVRATVGHYLETQLNTYIDTLRYQNSDLNAYLLPYPKQYLASDPYDSGNNTYPIIGTYFPTTRDFGSNVQYLMSGSEQYSINYDAVIFATVSTPYVGQDKSNLPMYATPGRDATIKVRDDMLAMVRAAILGSPSFGTAGTQTPVVANISTMTETYPEPMKIDARGGARWICSGLINLTIGVTEKVAVPAINDGNGNVALLQRVNIDMEELPFEYPGV